MSAPTGNGRSQASAGFARTLRMGLTTMVLIACLVCGAWWLARYKSERKLAQWKGPALERLTRVSISSAEVRQELEELKASNATNRLFDWAHEHVLLMTNGEYILYEYRHGANVYFPPHLFLGHCSDGRWLYSSYHFCNSMNMVRFEEAPGSISEFAKRYSAREFDGKSDECLKMTE